MTRLLASLILAGALVPMGCGPHAQLHPLVGEDERILADIGAAPNALFTDAPTLAAKTLLDGLMSGNHEAAWPHLSRTTQRALQACFAPDASMSATVLDRAATQLDSMGSSLMEFSFTTPPVEFTLHPPGTTPGSPPTQARSNTVIVYAIHADASAHPLPMTLEGHHWRKTVSVNCPTP